MNIDKEIKAIIFDLGGVLLNISYEKTIEAFENYGIKNFKKQFSKAEQSKLFEQLERGTISEAVWLEEMLRLTEEQLSKEQILLGWNAMLLDFPVERFALLKELSKDYKLYLLSNTNEIHIENCREQYLSPFTWNKFEGLFDEVFYSYEMGLRKPDKAIFEKVVKEIGLEPKNCLFIDDSPQHVESASKVGINAYHLKDHEDVLSLFQSQIKA